MRREQKNCLSPVSLSVFSLVEDLLFDCTRILEYAKIPTVLQSISMLSLRIVNRFRFLIPNTKNETRSRQKGLQKVIIGFSRLLMSSYGSACSDVINMKRI